MSSAIVVDLGSSAVKCGLANSYLTDTQPSVVSNLSGMPHLTVLTHPLRQMPAGSFVCVSLQVASTTLSAASATDGTQPGGSVQAIRDGQVEDWAALERILHDALYMQVGHPLLSSEAVGQC